MITDCSVIYRRVSKFIDSVDLRIVPDQQLYEILHPRAAAKNSGVRPFCSRTSHCVSGLEAILGCQIVGLDCFYQPVVLQIELARTGTGKHRSYGRGYYQSRCEANIHGQDVFTCCRRVKTWSGQFLHPTLYLEKLTNRRKTQMRPYQAVLIATTGLIVAAIAAFVLYGGGGSSGRGLAAIGGPFTLTDQTGKTRTERDFHESYNLICFGYTFCPDVPYRTASDDQRHGPSRQGYAGEDHADFRHDRSGARYRRTTGGLCQLHPRMIELTGMKNRSSRLCLRVYYAKSKESEGDTTDYLMDHSSFVFLMDPAGVYVTHFTHATKPDRMAETLQEKIGS